MRNLRISMVLLSLAGLSAYGVDQDIPFDRYRIILDRAPFGEAPPPDSGQPVVNVPPSESFAKKIRMSALLEDEGRIRVGLIDMTTNESFFLGVGDMELGIELISADYETEEAVLRKGPEMAVIKLQSGEITALNPAEQQARLQQQQAPPSGAGLSYAERRRQRQAAQRQPPAPPPPPPQPLFTGEDLQKHLQEYQMEVIRSGLPPLPIPLTEEMDDQLVAEGLLPPAQ